MWTRCLLVYLLLLIVSSAFISHAWAAETAQLRAVRQVVFGIDGQPARQTDVTASYVQDGRIVIRQAKTDQAGSVLWKAVPATPLTVWGDKAPACVVPADGEAFTSPLPAPAIDNTEHKVSISFTDAGAKPVAMRWALRTNFASEISLYETESAPGNDAAELQFLSGSMVDLVIRAETTQPQFASLRCYIPTIPADAKVSLSLTLQKAVQIHGRFVAAGITGQVPGVSVLDIMPVSCPDMPPLLAESPSVASWLLEPVQQLDGSFDIAVPCPGRYRLLPDLFDHSTTALPALQMSVKPGMNNITVTLPKPLFSVAAGTEVSWLTKNASADTKRLRACARRAQVPVFGPSGDLSAVWYKPQPDQLTIVRFPDGQPIVRHLTLRTQQVTLSAPDGKPLVRKDAPSSSAGRIPSQLRESDLPTIPQAYADKQLRLFPLLPVSLREMRAGTETTSAQSSEDASTPLTGDAASTVDLWSGEYVVGVQSAQFPLAFGDFSNADSTATGITLSRYPFRKSQFPRAISFVLPQGDYARWQQQGAAEYTASVNSTFRPLGPLTAAVTRPGLPVMLYVPSHAERISLFWPGVGSIKDFTLPPPPAQQANLPDWDTGVRISGTVLAADGTPVAGGSLTFRSAEFPDQSYTVPLSAEGTFQANGMYPGTVFASVTVKATSPSGGEAIDVPTGWTLQVPEQGLANVTLRFGDTATRIVLNSADPVGSVWWIPDEGTPTQLPRFGNLASTSVGLLGAGRLWVADGRQAGTYLQRLTLRPGWNVCAQEQASGPTLGITLPLDLDSEPPLQVTLAGEGTLAGVRAVFENLLWQPSAELHTLVGQIDAVPPGNYRVTILTPRGEQSAHVTVAEAGGYVAFENGGGK